jgi:hypothetical protein
MEVLKGIESDIYSPGCYFSLRRVRVGYCRPASSTKRGHLNKNNIVVPLVEQFISAYIDPIMNIIMRSWREQKILLKRIFPILSDEDFVFEEGNKESMLKKLEAKLGKSKPELELIFAEIQLL